MPTNLLRDHTSCLGESARELDMVPYSEARLLTSGAMNSGVPQNVLVVEPYHISSLHRP